MIDRILCAVFISACFIGAAIGGAEILPYHQTPDELNAQGPARSH